MIELDVSTHASGGSRPARYILVVGDVGDGVWTRLAAVGGGVTCINIRDAQADVLAAAEIVFVWDFRDRSLESLWPRLHSLRWIHTASAGVDHLLFPALRSSQVSLSNSAGVFSQPIAEYVLGLILLDAKGFRVTLDAQRERRWSYRETETLPGKQLLVVGLGDVGRRVAALGEAAGMAVSGVRRTGGPVPGLDGIRVFGRKALREALSESDYVVVATPLTPETSHLIGEREIRAMKPSAYVINVGRGAVVDESALTRALRDGRLRGAAIDTFDVEPLTAGSELWDVPNLFISPHMAGDARGWQTRVLDLFVGNLGRFIRAEGLLNIVDKSRGY